MPGHSRNPHARRSTSLTLDRRLPDEAMQTRVVVPLLPLTPVIDAGGAALVLMPR